EAAEQAAAPSRSSSDERSEETKRPAVPDAPPEVLAEQQAFRLAAGSLEDPPAPPPAPTSRPLSDERSEETKRPETKRPEASRPGDRRFRYTLLAVVGVLAVVVASLGAVSLFQGPRLSDVQVNPAEAIEVSGSRVILTANQALADVDPAQISIEPEVPFTVDAAGRGIGIRFTVPLDDTTEYTVRVSDVTGSGGGPASDLQTSFTTPASEIFLLQRSVDGDDAIFRTDLTGEQ